MNIWEMKTPNFVCNGQGSIKNLKNILPSNINSIFLVVDKNIKNSDFFHNILNELRDYRTVCFSNFNSDTEKKEVVEGAKAYKEFNPDCVLAVGGGSSIDAAKAIALLGENYNDLDKCFEKGNLKEEKFPYFIAIPATCGTGAESSPYAIIKDKDIPKKKTMERAFFIPKAVILDVDSLNTLDKKFRVATALDTLVHILEVHTSTTANNLIRINTRGALLSFTQCFSNGIFNEDKEALEQLQYIAFTARLLYPRTGLSIAHSIAHPLGAYTEIHHGMLVGAIMPEVIRYNKDFNSEYFKEATRLITNSTEIENLALWIEKVLEREGIYAYIKDKLKKKDLPIKEICNQAINSSNIRSNARKVKNVEELIEITDRVLQKIEQI